MYWGRFAAKCKADGMRISTFNRSCLKWRSSGLISEGKTDRQIGAASAVMRSVYWAVMVKKELDLPSAFAPTLSYGHDLWVVTIRTKGQKEFPPQGVWALL